MERDFMGLNSKEEAIEAVLSKSSRVQWSLANGYEAPNNRHSDDQTQQSIGDSDTVQLTIFYRGTVNVYNDMSPEKAQAIMLLAGNGTRAQGHVATPRTPAADGSTHVSQPINVSSPVYVGPSTGTSSGDAPKVMSSFRPLKQSDVPQMRGASLARFLEKRRERVLASAPYKSSSDSSSKPGSSNDDNK